MHKKLECRKVAINDEWQRLDRNREDVAKEKSLLQREREVLKQEQDAIKARP